jgi:hypothetical protein
MNDLDRAIDEKIAKMELGARFGVEKVMEQITVEARANADKYPAAPWNEAFHPSRIDPDYVDNPIPRTGNLYDHILDKLTSPDPDKIVGQTYVDNAAFYGKFLEEGTWIYGWAQFLHFKYVGGPIPYPFLKPAYTKVKKNAYDIIKREITDEVFGGK